MDKKTPYRIVASGKKAERRDYSKVSGNLELPNLVEIQTDSFEWFKNDGIAEVFNEIYPIQNYGGNIRLKFWGMSSKNQNTTPRIRCIGSVTMQLL